MGQATETVPVVETTPAPVVPETKPAETTPPVKTEESAVPEVKANDGTALTKTVETAEIVYDLKAPQGVDLDPAAISAFVEFAKAEKLPADLAQKIIDYGVKHEAERAKLSEKLLEDQVIKEENDGFEELKKDPELGGANYEQTLKLAAEGFQKFATKEEREFMDKTRLGNRVPIIKLFHRIALAMREEKPVGLGNNNDGAPPPKSDEAIYRQLYPNSPEMFGDTKE